MPRRQLVVLGMALGALDHAALAQPGPDGYDWAQIGAVGNAPYTGFSDPISPTYGRGGINYSYAMSRTEVTTGQWVSFLNAANARPDPVFPQNPTWTYPPLIWGGEVDPEYTGPGTRYRVRPNVPSAAMLPASGVSWRECAILCNWLNSGQSSSAESFRSGSYDTATFTGGYPTFTDQREHTPGAHYWIPTLDEYLKAAFYDPNGNGPGQERWWRYPIRSDSPPIYGPPPAFGGDGMAQANAGFRFPQNGERLIPLGSYPSVQSPWGLLDLAGCSAEWLEEVAGDATEMYRGIDGSSRGNDGGNYLDELIRWGSESPNSANPVLGVRLASDVPTPGTLLILSAGACVLAQRERRRKAWQGIVSTSSPPP